MRRKSFGATVVVLTAITHISHKYGIMNTENNLFPVSRLQANKVFLKCQVEFLVMTTGFATIWWGVGNYRLRSTTFKNLTVVGSLMIFFKIHLNTFIWLLVGKVGFLLLLEKDEISWTAAGLSQSNFMIIMKDFVFISRGIEWSLRAFASMRAVRLFLRARAVINFVMRTAST